MVCPDWNRSLIRCILAFFLFFGSPLGGEGLSYAQGHEETEAGSSFMESIRHRGLLQTWNRFGSQFEPELRQAAQYSENWELLVLSAFADAKWGWSSSSRTPGDPLGFVLDVVESKFYSPQVSLERRQEIALTVLKKIAKLPAPCWGPRLSEDGTPEPLRLYDRLRAGGVLRPDQAREALDLFSEFHPQASGLSERELIWKGAQKEVWRAPYKNVEGLPRSTFDLYTQKEFVPLGEFSEARKIQNALYPIPYQPQRQKMQDGWIQKLIQHGTHSHTPRLIFTSGPLGSGKSTALKMLAQQKYYLEEDFLVIDPDEIRAWLPEYAGWLQGSWSPYAAHLTQHEAMDIADMALEVALQSKKNIIFATSLRDLDHYQKLLERIQKTQPLYQLELVKILVNPELILRVNRDANTAPGKEFADRSGRQTPVELALQSIQEVEASTQKLQKYFDRVAVVDNRGSKPVLQTFENLRRGSGQPRTVAHVMFDLDWVILDSIPNGVERPSHEPAWQWIQVENQWYRVPDGLDEMLGDLVQQPDLRIGFISGGNAFRNQEALRKIFPPSLGGRSLDDIAQVVLSRDSLIDAKPNEKKFDLRYQKDLDAATRGALEVALFDDQKGFIQGARGWGAWTGKTYDYFETFALAQEARRRILAGEKLGYELEYIPETYEEWLADRNKLRRFHLIIQESLIEWRAGKKRFGNIVAGQDQKISRAGHVCRLIYGGS